VIAVYDEEATRIEFFGDEIEKIYRIHPLTGEILMERDSVAIYPASYYVAPVERMAEAIENIENELEQRYRELETQGKLLEAQRIKMRTTFDLEMIRELGFCSGIENYSRHIDGRLEGEPPACLLDYFPEDFLTVIDESHVTVPQIGAMYNGDSSRKRTLVEHGFRLPSALDNRPLKFEEFLERTGQTVYLSATPSKYELKNLMGLSSRSLGQPVWLTQRLS
jgi:excinuclease ABC subunit B